jgi:hypothetical protein
MIEDTIVDIIVDTSFTIKTKQTIIHYSDLTVQFILYSIFIIQLKYHNSD